MKKILLSFQIANMLLRLVSYTAALIAAYKSLNLKIGDNQITPRSFVATCSAAVEIGLKPVFADVILTREILLQIQLNH